MRIEKIKLLNYRQYQNEEISFPKKAQNDLHVFIGRNGVGKTNVLNAINWCLYDDEPHLSNTSNQEPIVNKKARQEADRKDLVEVGVEIQTRTDNGQLITFRRKKYYSISETRTTITQAKAEFTVFIKDHEGNDKRIDDIEETKSYVKRFVPEKIREYFFFDGDRLENYFREMTGSKIQEEIMQISQIGTLEEMKNRLRSLSNEYSRDAGRINPHVEKLRQDLEKEDEILNSLKGKKTQTDEQIQAAKVRIEQISTELTGIPDVAELEKERLRVVGDVKKKSDLIVSKKVEKNKALYKYSVPLLLFKPMNHAKNLIVDKKARGEFPPTTDLDMLDASLQEGSCRICGRQIDDSAKNHIEGIKRQLTMSTMVASSLMSIESTLDNRQSLIREYSGEIKRINREIKQYDEDLALLNTRLQQLDLSLQTYGKDRIRELQEERAKLDSSKEKNVRRSAELERDIAESEKAYRGYRKELERAEVNEEKAKQLIKKHKFCNDAIQIISDTKEQLLNEVRKNIEEATNKNFFELIWKKSTFKCVKIESDYSVNLLTDEGISMLGTGSKAENELLALAFTLGLHKVSGFDAPILIDTPVARVSDTQRENFGKILEKVSTRKQTILLFSLDEYSDNIRGIIEPAASNIYRIQMAKDEKSSAIEVN